jgi:hypothetical protein
MSAKTAVVMAPAPVLVAIPNPSSLFRRGWQQAVLISAFAVIILGLVATVAWTAFLGYSVVILIALTL